MLLVISFNYILICSLCFLCAGWMVIKVLSEKTPFSDSSDGDDSGGIPADCRLPIFDPPGGCHLDDLLVDRLPRDRKEINIPVGNGQAVS